MYNKLLIAMFLAALGAGIALVGPRRLLVSPWVLGSAALALLIGSPNLVYQATHDWPELTMGRALADNNSSDVHLLMWPFLLILLGPPLTAVWGAGLVALWRRPAWRPVRFVAAGFPVLLVLVFVAGTQLYYPYGYLVVLFAAGCVPTADLIERSRPWRIVLVVAIAVNALVSAAIALPLVPLSALGSTPIPGINQTAGDSVGWPAYVQQIANVYDDLPPRESEGAVVIASNYGEAGAVARFGPGARSPRGVRRPEPALLPVQAPSRHHGRGRGGWAATRCPTVVRGLHRRGAPGQRRRRRQRGAGRAGRRMPRSAGFLAGDLGGPAALRLSPVYRLVDLSPQRAGRATR